MTVKKYSDALKSIIFFFLLDEFIFKLFYSKANYRKNSKGI